MRQADRQSRAWGWSGPGEAPKAALSRVPKAAPFLPEGQGRILPAGLGSLLLCVRGTVPRPPSEGSTSCPLVSAHQRRLLLRKEGSSAEGSRLGLPADVFVFFWPPAHHFLSVSSLQDMVTKYQKRKNKP